MEDDQQLPPGVEDPGMDESDVSAIREDERLAQLRLQQYARRDHDQQIADSYYGAAQQDAPDR